MKRLPYLILAFVLHRAWRLQAQPAPIYTLKSCLEQGLLEQLFPANRP